MGGLALFAKALLTFTALPEFWIPIATVPLWVATSFDRRTAFVVTVVLAFVLASLLDFDWMLLSVLLTRGMAATLLYFDRKHARRMVISGVLAGICAAALYVAIRVAFGGHFDVVADLERDHRFGAGRLRRRRPARRPGGRITARSGRTPARARLA